MVVSRAACAWALRSPKTDALEEGKHRGIPNPECFVCVFGAGVEELSQVPNSRRTAFKAER